MPEVDLVVRGGRHARGRLELQVALVNTGDRPVPPLPASGRDVRLAGPDESLGAPLEVSETLESLTTSGGLPARGRNEGALVFLVEAVDGVHQLLVPGFPPLSLDLAALPALAAAEPEPAADRWRGVDELLAAQAAALEGGDRDAFVDTFTGLDAHGAALVTEQLRRARVEAVTIERTGEPSPTGDRSLRADVTFTYWLEDLPRDNPFLHRLHYDLEEELGRWYVRQVSPMPGDRLPFWLEPGMVSATSEHFLLYGRVADEQHLLELAAPAEQAYARLRGLGLPLAERYAMHLLPQGEIERLAGPQAVGAALALYLLQDGEIRVHNKALYLNALLYRGRDRGYQPLRELRQETLQHELVHLAFIDRTRPATPVWLTEGAAVYFSGGIPRSAPARLVRQPLSLAALVDDRSLRHHGDVTAAYELVGCAVAYIVQQHGMTAFARLYQAFAELPPERAMEIGGAAGALTRGGEAAAARGIDRGAQTDEIVRAVLGISLAELDEGLRGWLEREARAAG